MLEPLWPGVVGEWADQAHHLADYLGDDHDLWVLREAARKKRDAFHVPADLDALVALIDRRRKQLQDKAWLLGARLYEPNRSGCMRGSGNIGGFGTKLPQHLTPKCDYKAQTSPSSTRDDVQSACFGKVTT